jgi:hypothetical protein
MAASAFARYVPSRSRRLFLAVLLTTFLSSHARAFQARAPCTGRSQGMRSSLTRTISQHPRADTSVRVDSQLNLSAKGCVKGAVLVLRGGEISALMESSYGWCMNLGAPAALVAGAVIATIYEGLNSGDLNQEPEDSKLTKFSKKLTRFLLLSAFALEVMSIFVTTITGTMLLSRTVESMASVAVITDATTPMMFMRENFEFEYLTSRITFLQGLLNWMAAIALGHWLPAKGESKATRKMNKMIAFMLLTTIVLMVSFYNAHMTFYPNYGAMLTRWCAVTFKRFLCRWPPRPLAVIFVPCFLASLFFGYEALTIGEDEEGEQCEL